MFIGFLHADWMVWIINELYISTWLCSDSEDIKSSSFKRSSKLTDSMRESKEIDFSEVLFWIIGSEDFIYLVSKKGKIFCIKNNEIFYANEYSLGYLNEKTQLKNDYFLKIMASNHYLDIETNKNKSARLDLNKLNFKSNKSNFLIDFLKLDNDEYLENCFRLENFLD